MIETPQITQTPAQRIAIIPVSCARSEIHQVMGPGITELMATVKAQGLAPTGPWFTHHLHNPDDRFDFEIGVPVGSPVTASGRVKPSERPALTVAQTVYHGNYDGLGNGWGEFERWIASNGHVSSADLWETYVIDPSTSPTPADWRTRLQRPLAG